MRLNPFDTSKIDVRGGGGGGGMRAGGVGCGAIVIALIGALVFGIDPMDTLSTVEGMQGGQATQESSDMTEQQLCSQNQYASETCSVLGSLNETWAGVFQEQNVQGFNTPSLTFIQGGGVRTACGAASSAMGPFYCPADEGIYIDTRFYDQLAQMSGDRGDFARLYVIAHEYGHHIQKITGIADAIRSAQQQNPRAANQLQVRMELQADCYAGVWAGRNRNRIDPGDVEEGMRAASAIGDDTLTQGRVSAENFTHGTSQQRMQALELGMRGDDRQCDAITQIR
ncbi:KPN_02809 family neutral zinc metallopeptidase [Altererythrobacter sp. CAU 1778]